MKYYKAYIFVINLKIEEFFKEPFHGPLTKAPRTNTGPRTTTLSTAALCNSPSFKDHISNFIRSS